MTSNVEFFIKYFSFSFQTLLNDSKLYLLLVRKHIPKSDLLKIIFEAEEGRHVNIPGVDLIPVTAFRMVPENSGKGSQDSGNGNKFSGNMTSDGESLPVGPIQAQIMPNMATLYVK